MSWWIWVLLAFLLLAVEFATTTLHVGFFAVGSLLVAALVAAGVGGPLWGQLLIFAISSVVALMFIRPVIVRRLGMNRPVTVDTMIGEQAVALAEIPASGVGKAELRGSTWTAQNIGPTAVGAGQRCTVERVEGLTLHVRP